MAIHLTDKVSDKKMSETLSVEAEGLFLISFGKVFNISTKYLFLQSSMCRSHVWVKGGN